MCKMFKRYLIGVFLSSFILILPSISHAVINLPVTGTAVNAVEVAYLRKDCSSQVNCATTFQEMLDWTWNTRSPIESNPLLIDIGTGVFELKSTLDGNDLPLQFCKNNGFVTLRGSGRDNTVISGGGASYGLAFDIGTKYRAVLGVTDCTNLSFQDLTIRATGESLAGVNVHHGIVWRGAGISTWTNVAVEASMYGWVDTCTAANTQGKHFWFSSKISSSGAYYNIAYASTCGINTFYGGELIVFKAPNITTSGTLVGVIAQGSLGNIDIYGSLVRAVNSADSSATYGGFIPNSSIFSGHGGMLAKNQGSIHMHGGIVSVKSDTLANSSLFGVAVEGGGQIHTPDTAFGLKPSGTGSATRVINNGGSLNSPFQWPSSINPPAINTETGADTFVETDCDNAGDCSGNSLNPMHPHMMIYDASCNAGANPWFDIATNACRQ
jgi:hypothetical protein